MISLFKVYMHPEVHVAVGQVLQSGYIGQGPAVDRFETELADMTGDTLLTTCSGTAALDLALHLSDVGPGDEVLTTAQTCTATNGVIVRRGAIPVWCDVDPDTGNIDPFDVARNMNAKVKAIMAVDWGGRACNYDALRSHGVPVIEDAAHAVGTTIQGEHVAKSGGNLVCFSFQAIKHLTTVDGGAIRVPSEQVERARLLRWYGLDRRGSASFRCEQDIGEVGYKYHMNDVAATIGIANLDALPWILKKHRDNASRLCRELSAIPGVQTPRWDPESSWWIYTIKVANVAEFIMRMKERGIDTSPVHARNDKHTAFRAAGRPSSNLSGLEDFSKHQVAIPVGWWLTDVEILEILDATEDCVKP